MSLQHSLQVQEHVSKQKAEAKKAGNIRGTGARGTPEQFATSRYFKREAANSTNAVAHTEYTQTTRQP